MAAVDIPEIYRFEEAFEGAAIRFLNAATGLTVYRSNMITDFTTPRIEVKFEVGDAYEPPVERGGGAAPTTIDYVGYNASVGVIINTDNSVEQSGDMPTYLGQVREAMARSADNWTQTETAISGTAVATSGSATVDGTGTAFESELMPGSIISVSGSPTYSVGSITSDTELELAANASQSNSGSVTTGGIPYYDLKSLRPSNTTISIDGDLNEVELAYDIVFEIRRDAWPA